MSAIPSRKCCRRARGCGWDQFRGWPFRSGRRIVHFVIGIPIWVVATGERVEIQNGVDLVFCANLNSTINVFESVLLQHSRVHVIFEIMTLPWQLETVRSIRSEELCILVQKKVRQELVKEGIVLLLSENLEHTGPVLRLHAGETGDEAGLLSRASTVDSGSGPLLLHIHSSSQCRTSQEDRLPIIADDLVAFNLEYSSRPIAQ